MSKSSRNSKRKKSIKTETEPTPIPIDCKTTLTEVKIPKCLICNQVTYKNSLGLLLEPLKFNSNKKLSSEIAVIFIVKKLLGTSSELCEELLTSCGSPSNWGLEFCSLCHRIIQEAEFLFHRIQGQIKEFQELSKRLKKVISSSQDEESEVPNSTTIGPGNRRERKRKGKSQQINTTPDVCPTLNIRQNICKKFKGDADNAHFESSIASFESSNVNVGHHKQLTYTIASLSDEEDENDDAFGDIEFNDHIEIEDFNLEGEEGKAEKLEHLDNLDIQIKKEVPEVGDVHEDNFYFDPVENDKDADFDPTLENYEGNEESEHLEEDSDYEVSHRRKRSKRKVGKSRKRPNNLRNRNSKSKPDPGKKQHIYRYPYPCNECVTSFPKQSSLDAHILRRHYGISHPYSCDLCDRRFRNDIQLKMHKGISHPESTVSDQNQSLEYDGEAEEDVDRRIILAAIKMGNEKLKCDQCTKTFTNELQLEGHQRKHAGIKKPYICPLESCKKCVTTFMILVEHCHRHLSKNHYHCTYPNCNKRFKSKLCKDAHIQKVHKGQSGHKKGIFKCQYCSKKLQSWSSLVKHQRSYHPKALPQYDTSLGISNETKVTLAFQCPECQQSFESRLGLEAHIRKVHYEMKSSFPCTKCPQKCITETELMQHHHDKHTNNGSEGVDKLRVTVPLNLSPPYICIQCDNKKFISRETLRAHLLRHTMGKYAMCEFCSKSFVLERYLKEHQQRVHYDILGVKPYSCDYCGKILNSKRTLDAHVRQIHTGETPYNCDHKGCTRGFMEKLQLRRHITIAHTKDKPFKCSQCPKQFAQSFYLRNHLRVHTGEKPYKCTHCGKLFSDKPTYNRHMETHGDKVHKCEVCGKEFKVWHAFRLHMKSHDKTVPKRRKVLKRKVTVDSDADEDGNENFMDHQSTSLLVKNAGGGTEQGTNFENNEPETGMEISTGLSNLDTSVLERRATNESDHWKLSYLS